MILWKQDFLNLCMHTHFTQQLRSDQQQELWKLWNQEYPVHLNYLDFADFEKYLNTLTDARHHLIADENDHIIGWAFDFEREAERWFGILLDSKFQHQGHGTKLMQELMQHNTSLCGWVIDHSRDLKPNGEVYHSPIQFYKKLGFSIQPDVRLGFDRISAVRIDWARS